jgi:hypothetical protein
MKVIVGVGGMQFNEGSESQWGPSILHFPRVLFVFKQKKFTHRSDLGLNTSSSA